jgi:hypothetical protein
MGLPERWDCIAHLAFEDEREATIGGAQSPPHAERRLCQCHVLCPEPIPYLHE